MISSTGQGTPLTTWRGAAKYVRCLMRHKMRRSRQYSIKQQCRHVHSTSRCCHYLDVAPQLVLVHTCGPSRHATSVLSIAGQIRQRDSEAQQPRAPAITAACAPMRSYRRRQMPGSPGRGFSSTKSCRGSEFRLGTWSEQCFNLDCIMLPRSKRVLQPWKQLPLLYITSAMHSRSPG